MGISKYALELYDNSSFEKRDSQRKMISYIGDSMDRALELGRREKICVEAPTGTGKSLGILVPALAAWLLYEKRTVIATRTHVLQDQLFTKDIPALIKAVSVEPEFQDRLAEWRPKIVKGRNGSYCIKKLDDLITMVDKNGPFMTNTGQGVFVADKLKLTPLRADIVNKVPRLSYPDHHPLMNYIRSDRDNCAGVDCPYCAASCPYYTGLRFNTPILITNHALLSAFLRKDEDEMDLDDEDQAKPKVSLGILNGDFYFFDEAHHLMGYHFGGTKTLEVSDTDVEKLNSLLPMDTKFKQEFNELCSLRDRFFRWWESLKIELSKPKGIKWGDWERELKAMMKLWESVSKSEVFDVIVEQDMKILNSVYGAIGTVLSSKKNPIPSGSGWYLVDSGERSFDDDLAKFPKSTMVGFCSGTLIPDHSLSTFEAEVGVKCTREPLIVPSPFDFKNMRFWVPKYGEMPGKGPLLNKELPLDRESFYDNYVCDFIKTYVPPYVEQNLGGVLILCSSYKRMNLVRKVLQLQNKRLLVQGSMTKSALVGEFFDNPSSVLLGTDSFREGFDAPGKTLTWVIIDRLPFPSPANPELALRIDGLLRGGYINSPMEHSMKLMKFNLVQSVGRLIRTPEDYGTVTLLDSRGYHKAVQWGIHDCIPVPPSGWKTDWPSVSDWIYDSKKQALLARA